tara:strand:+ start:2518 stop:2829 length:312 start_codon:yes stop_codon:yes gene_type:complete
MKINFIKNYILFTIEKKDNPILIKLEINKENYNNYNKIVDLSNIIPDQFIIVLKNLINQNDKSFVIVTEKIDYEIDNLNLVPTIQEAIDFIDLEEIERDLNSL